MRRARRTHQYEGDEDYGNTYQSLQTNGDAEDLLVLERLSRTGASKQPQRFENSIEAKVQDGDTLQALALRFHCTVADIKRLNKIDKDNEIHARKVVKIPVNSYSVLLETQPTVHKSGSTTPNQMPHDSNSHSHIERNPLEDARVMLSEKLMVASVNSAGVEGQTAAQSLNSVILNSKFSRNAAIAYTDNVPSSSLLSNDFPDNNAPLLDDILDDETLPRLRPIRGPSIRALDWSGSDCDMSWVCLFVLILGLCFVIPLIYIIYLAEHPHHHNGTSH